MTIDLVRNRPVFDENIVKPGVAIKFKYKEGHYAHEKTWRNGIIFKSDLTDLEISVYDGEGDMDTVYIDVEEVIDEDVAIEILK